MRLERLEISGFKSFSDRSELAFDEGVTAIVGPNGCGKSNVADAITWVLGEQSAKSLRGEKMEDVIFNGSDARKPGATAEVRLRLTGLTAPPAASDSPAPQTPDLRQFQASTADGQPRSSNGHSNGNGMATATVTATPMATTAARWRQPGREPGRSRSSPRPSRATSRSRGACTAPVRANT